MDKLDLFLPLLKVDVDQRLVQLQQRLTASAND